jgi:hypothetical protein
VGEEQLEQRQGRKRVDGVHRLESLERVVSQMWLRARAENAGVVDGEVEAASLDGCAGDALAVPRVGHVTRDSGHRCAIDHLCRGGSETIGIAAVDDDVPSAADEFTGKRTAKTSRAAADEGD